MNSSHLALQGCASNTAHGEAFAPAGVGRGIFSPLDGGISADELRSLLAYNQESGEFRWARNVGRKMRAGDVAGCKNDRGYIVIRISGIGYRAHRLAWLHVHGVWPHLHVDHINGNRADNRIANLRLATLEINTQNRGRASKGNTSGLLGVINGKRPSARIEVNGKSIHLGCFDTAEEAHAAYLAAKRQLHEGYVPGVHGCDLRQAQPLSK